MCVIRTVGETWILWSARKKTRGYVMSVSKQSFKAKRWPSKKVLHEKMSVNTDK